MSDAMRITVNLGELYEDCYLDKKLSHKSKDRNDAIERMASVVKSLRDNGHTVDLQLGHLVGAMTQGHALLFKSGELETALSKALKAVETAAA